ncbi:AAC(3) family N-acetyltransferase [Rubripirellula amarantea]|nr:AAC(3) family N-acetyltransferase [Rubripirellula amarantea]
MSAVELTLEVLRDLPCSGPVLVHADLMRARSFVGPVTSRQAMLAAQVEVLREACGSRPFWSPCFNYDFCKTGEVDLRSAKSQVGPLGEYLRTHSDFWRSTDPVFSICGDGRVIEDNTSSTIEAFGPLSGLAQLYSRGGAVLFYGAALSSATILHFAETLSGGPVYRYDKVFSGTMVSLDGVNRATDYIYHVRPMGWSLDYDWTRIRNDLIDQNLIRQQTFRGEEVAMACVVADLVDYWVERLSDDPLYFLDSDTRAKVESLKLSRGQRVSRNEFEQAT